MSVIDKQGFRLNIGIVLINDHAQVFWGHRVRSKNAWQFPQGGIIANETLEETLYRELYEELGLRKEHVKVLAKTHRWQRYWLPKHFRRHQVQPLCIGQKQKWFLLKLIADESEIHFDLSGTPEFQGWRWVDYWYPLEEVIEFKKEVYENVLKEFEPIVFR